MTGATALRNIQADAAAVLDALDRQIIVATQEGLPRVARPYHAIAEILGVSAEEVMMRLRRMLDVGVVRRIGAVPNHYALGYRANGMSVWDVPDENVTELGRKIGELDFVSHCYHRPRHQPEWPYNLFAMIHGKSRDEVLSQLERMIDHCGLQSLAHEVLFSRRRFKQCGAVYPVVVGRR